jgi:hypothetical protein
MENWQFLLQKEEDAQSDDRSASSLLKASNNSTIAIEEGKYRIIAHSNSSNVDVAIEISHQVVNTGKSLRRSQKRSRSTNESGLVVILPFTNLQPGWWEIQCSGELLSEESRRSWQKKLEIQVYSKSERENLDAARLQEVQHQRRSTDRKKEADLHLKEKEVAIVETLDEFLTTQERSLETSDWLRQKAKLESNTLEENTSSIRKNRQAQIYRPSQTTSSVHVNLFDPKKLAKESMQTQPLTGQILPPKMPANEEAFNKPLTQEYPRSPKPVELPKVNLPKIEPINFSQLPLPTQQTEENLSSSDSSEANRVEGLNLQQRFWSLINSLASDSSKETETDNQN